jgi:hypothetical protein
MRKNDILYLALVLLLTVGCVKDNSSEIHVVLNDVCIEGIEERYENVYVDHPLCITPQVSTLRGTDFSHLDFYWITYNKSNYTHVDTLAHTKDLNIVVCLTPGEHYLKFKAFDRLTGIFYEKETVLNVVNDFTNGLLILVEEEDEAVLDFWVPGRNEVIRDLYGKLENGASLGRNPHKVYFTRYTSELASEVVVMCQDEDGGKILDNTTMAYKRDYADLFFGIGKADYVPQAYFRSSMREYLVDGGLVYDRAINSNPPSMQVRPAMNVSSGAYEIAPEANFGDDNVSVARMVLYDNCNQCFYTLYEITSAFLTTVRNTSGMKYVKGGYFDPDNVGMRCIYANICSRSQTEAREYAGVFVDEDGGRWLLRLGIGFWVEGASPNRYLKDLGKLKVDDPTFQRAVSYTCCAEFPGYMFYAEGSRIYAFSIFGGLAWLVYDFNGASGGSYVIDHIEMERGGSRIWVAFRDLSRDSLSAGFSGLDIRTDGGLSMVESVRHDNIADRIVDFESKY